MFPQYLGIAVVVGAGAGVVRWSVVAGAGTVRGCSVVVTGVRRAVLAWRCVEGLAHGDLARWGGSVASSLLLRPPCSRLLGGWAFPLPRLWLCSHSASRRVAFSWPWRVCIQRMRMQSRGKGERVISHPARPSGTRTHPGCEVWWSRLSCVLGAEHEMSTVL